MCLLVMVSECKYFLWRFGALLAAKIEIGRFWCSDLLMLVCCSRRLDRCFIHVEFATCLSDGSNATASSRLRVDYHVIAWSLNAANDVKELE